MTQLKQKYHQGDSQVSDNHFDELVTIECMTSNVPLLGWYVMSRIRETRFTCISEACVYPGTFFYQIVLYYFINSILGYYPINL